MVGATGFQTGSCWFQCEYKSINLKNKIKCLVTYHPAFLLRSPNYKKQSWEDLKMIEKKIVDENI